MVEPTTTNRGFIVPNTGDLVGAWGTSALNPNFNYLDGLLGGVLSLSLSAATTIGLSASTAPITPSAGPFQQNNALIKLSGSLSGNAILQFTQPGFYIVHNSCTVNSFYVALAPASGTGNQIGAPPGRKCWVFFDGTSMDYADPPEPGSALDLHGATALPAWMSACSVLPYLIKDGTVYSVSTYPALGAMFGSAFGGNGITTFGVPDELARARIGFDTKNTGRLTTAVCGFSGNAMGAAGGDQNLASHTHTPTLTDPAHTHPAFGGGPGNGQPQNSFEPFKATSFTTSTATAVTGITVAIATTGSGVGANVQPSIVSFLPLVKT